MALWPATGRTDRDGHGEPDRHATRWAHLHANSYRNGLANRHCNVKPDGLSHRNPATGAEPASLRVFDDLR